MSMDHATRPARLQTVEEADAVGEVAAIYDEIKRRYQVPFVPNLPKGLGPSEAALGIHWTMVNAWAERTTLPMSLSTMIWYTIASKSDCNYCAANQELSCRNMGIDAATREVITNPLHPYAKALISAVAIPDPAYKRPIPDIRGEVSQPIDPPPGCRFQTRCKEVMNICEREDPPLFEAAPGHCVSCHLYTQK